MFLCVHILQIPHPLKVLSYWNLNEVPDAQKHHLSLLKVLSYWNLNNCPFILAT